MTLTYVAHITETKKRDGTFTAKLIGHPQLTVTSRDVEYDLCFAILQAGLADAPIQFVRNNAPSLSFPSAHRTAKRRIEMGEAFPYREVERRSGPDFENSRCGVHQDGDLPWGASSRAESPIGHSVEPDDAARKSEVQHNTQSTPVRVS